ncbi:ATP-binding protein [Nocardioides acrostichi]|uniref:PspC domain-containing protein n=1 Tax=Nocardioides acrostichi TaxID=2784339 RepID=A0A930V1Z3_9ACTN|nr:ATP-binding protein [Nocardioides acrostichi]MBF4161734.1 PspC domain-containing protein [Nocardioides acrostichi]
MSAVQPPSRIAGSAREPRRAYRDTDGQVIGGVCAGLARHLALPVLWVRVAFVVTAVVSGLGLAMYAGLWFLLPSDTRLGLDAEAPGLASARRGGRRAGPVRRLADSGPVIALAALAVGLLFVIDGVFARGAVLWPLLAALVGVGLLWRQADEAQRERWVDATGRMDPVRVVFGSGGWAAYGRVAAGAVLVSGAFLLFALRGGNIGQARDLTLAALVGVAGIAVVIGPWVLRLATDLTEEREERVRSQERADVAAHVHDSVLQTLALIQKTSHDPAAVARLARAQERDLRTWLFEAPAQADAWWARSLRDAAAEVEDAYGSAVDVVTVGDASLDDVLRAVLGAAREAMTNAAKHAGVPRVDVYAEVADGRLECFVRDRGAGFLLDQMPGDRHGVRHSVIGRMERCGGRAEVRSTPGEGTEVRLAIDLPKEES